MAAVGQPSADCAWECSDIDAGGLNEFLAGNILDRVRPGFSWWTGGGRGVHDDGALGTNRTTISDGVGGDLGLSLHLLHLHTSSEYRLSVAGGLVQSG